MVLVPVLVCLVLVLVAVVSVDSLPVGSVLVLTSAGDRTDLIMLTARVFVIARSVVLMIVFRRLVLLMNMGSAAGVLVTVLVRRVVSPIRSGHAACASLDAGQ